MNSESLPIWLKVDTFDELLEHEREILLRIADIPNGGQLFLVHPFMLLTDIGVELSERATQEIIQQEHSLSALSTLPYHALKSSQQKSRLQVHLRGLFQRRES
jgi:hypothetical protein